MKSFCTIALFLIGASMAFTESEESFGAVSSSNLLNLIQTSSKNFLANQEQDNGVTHVPRTTATDAAGTSELPEGPIESEGERNPDMPREEPEQIWIPVSVATDETSTSELINGPVESKIEMPLPSFLSYIQESNYGDN